MPYFKTTMKKLSLQLPTQLADERVEAELVLKVWVSGALVSKNEYDVLLGSKEWGRGLSNDELCY